MKLAIRVNPNAKATRVDDAGGGRLTVSVKAAPKTGRANRAVVEAVASHFGISSARVKIVSGHSARDKVLSVV